jgi:hypothetical protein
VAESLPMLMRSTTLMLRILVVAQWNTLRVGTSRDLCAVKARDVVIDESGLIVSKPGSGDR